MVLSSRRVWAVVLSALVAVPLVGLEALTTGGAGAAVTSFSDATVSRPTSITAGPDGQMWFTNAGNSSIGAIATDGTRAISNFTDPSISSPSSIAVGIDGNLWFTNAGNSSIGQITTDGTISSFTDPSISDPSGIAAGSDGNLWFTNAGNSSIGQITTDGSGTVSSFSAASVSFPTSITSGPDGALWFTNAGNSSIGRITTGGVVTNFTDAFVSSPTSIKTGPDGALWFTNGGNHAIGRITTAGALTHFTDASISAAQGIAVGPDGALWFTNAGNSSIGRITTAGAVTHFTDPNVSGPRGIAKGPDGALWFTNAARSSVGRFTVQVPGIPTAVSAVPFGNGGAKVVWAAPASNGAPITGYVVRPYLGTVAQPARVFNSAATSEIVTGLKNGSSYQFTVAARNAGGTGSPSAKSTAIVIGVPGRPGTPTAVRTAAGSLRVSFVAPGNNGAAITSYTVTCTSTNGGVTKAKVGKASPITDTGLTAGKIYRCTVRATNSRGTGPASLPSAAVTA